MNKEATNLLKFRDVIEPEEVINFTFNRHFIKDEVQPITEW
jgi:hypothetical protein